MSARSRASIARGADLSTERQGQQRRRSVLLAVSLLDRRGDEHLVGFLDPIGADGAEVFFLNSSRADPNTLRAWRVMNFIRRLVSGVGAVTLVYS